MTEFMKGTVRRMMDPSPKEAEDVEEVSALEYARLNGLSLNHLTQPLPFSYLPKVPSGLIEDFHLPQVNFGDQVNLEEERLPVSEDAVKLLSWVSATNDDDSIDLDRILQSLPGRRGPKSLRVELPILRTDHEMDCRTFAKREGFEIDLKDVKFPLEVVDEENDEGLEFTQASKQYANDIMLRLQKEKLAFSVETVRKLQELLRPAWTEVDEQNLRAGFCKYERKRTLEPVTPPLSPMMLPVSSPERPPSSDPVYQIPLLSDPESLTQADLERLEAQIYGQDVPTPIRNMTCGSSETAKLGFVEPLSEFLDDFDTSSPTRETQRPKYKDLKVEETLTPPTTTTVPRSVHFSDYIEEMYLDASVSPQPFSDGALFDEAFIDAGTRAIQATEQESLVEADTLCRVPIPAMDFSKPDPPWSDFLKFREPEAILKLQQAMMRTAIGESVPIWPLQKLKEIKLQWNPFPYNLANVVLDESLEGDEEVWKEFVVPASDEVVIDSSKLVWKPPGLRILREVDDDDDEIEYGQFSNSDSNDLAYLAKKRKIEMEEAELKKSKKHLASLDHLLKTKGKSLDFVTAAEKLTSERTRDGEQNLLMGGPFSIETALDNFLDLRGTKKPKLTDSSYFQAASKVSSAPASGMTQYQQKEKEVEVPIRLSPIASIEALPIPPIRNPQQPSSIIISSTLFKRRNLIKDIEAQNPGLRIVERDFSAHNTTVWMQSSVSRSPIISSLDSEADLIVSPSTGLIITTLQKIKQRPLPGQKAKVAIRDRIEKVALRYEKLVVFVTESQPDESTNGLDETDCLAFSEFVGFTSGLQTTTLVHFVGGGDQALGKWLASSVSQHVNLGECGLLDGETHWELFLRRAGMNSMAAQAISANLKAPDDTDSNDQTVAGRFGLLAFINMGKNERVSRFGPLCGKRLMERVSAVLDARWD